MNACRLKNNNIVHVNNGLQTIIRKKYGVADIRYFKNGKTQRCDIFSYNKYSFCLVVCEISTS